MLLKWLVLWLLLGPASAEISSKKFVRMQDYHVVQESSVIIYRNIASRIQCTAVCRLKSCLSADYLDGTCTVHTEISELGDGGSSYMTQGSLDSLMTNSGFSHYKNGRYISIIQTTEEAGKTHLLCQKPFSFGTRFMIVEAADMQFVNDLYDEKIGPQEEKKLWLGLTDKTNEGVARWDDGRDFVEYPGWEWASSDGSNDGVKDLVFITVKKEPRKWYAEYKTPTDTEEGVICEVTIPDGLFFP